jgi:hypothetical protein
MLKKQKILKTVGYIILLISCLSFIMILVVPWFGFSKIQLAGITTGLIIVGEILFYLSLFILGRSFYNKSDISSFEELTNKSQSIGSQLVITTMSAFKDRIKVILVGECLGF